MMQRIANKSTASIRRICNRSNCGNNKMLESDWFLTALIYCSIWLVQLQTLRFVLSDY